MARLREDARGEPTGLDIIRMRRALRGDDFEALGSLASDYGMTWPDVAAWFAEYDDGVRELATGRGLMRLRRAAVLEAAGVPRDVWELDA